MDSFFRSLSMESINIPDESTLNEEMMENTREETTIERRTMNIERENQRNVEKRVREDSEEIIEGDDGFTTVTRKAKKLNRSNSQNHNCMDNVGSCDNDTQQEKYFEVCITSKTVLPKMVGMAKLLKSQNINNILKIKYKSPYKIFIILKYIEDTNKILNCQKFKELEFRCQRTDQLSIIYGIVKNIDLEIEENELVEIFQSEVDIFTVKRLKRITEEGQWINSEAIRIAFKGATLPSHIYGYGCRFKVETYMFPVTQCSGCWKYGHIKRFCPTQKILCPKCGKKHDNCETEEFLCINCKGPHMALNKNCPVYLKEKMIREIMSKDKCSYKKALDFYVTQLKKSKEVTSVHVETLPPPASSSNTRSYRDALTPREPSINPVNTRIDSSSSLEEVSESEEEGNKNRTTFKSIKKKKKKQNEKKKEQSKGNTKQNVEEGQKEKNHTEVVEESPYRNENIISKLKKCINKVKEIWLADCSIEQKVKKSIRLVLEEIMMYVVSYFKDWDIVSKLLGLFING